MPVLKMVRSLGFAFAGKKSNDGALQVGPSGLLHEKSPAKRGLKEFYDFSMSP
jgi:hypothetical protein